MIFRFDDVCKNTDLVKLCAMADMVRRYGEVQCSISMFCNDMSAFDGKNREFAFLPINKAYSDHRRFYNVDRCGYPELPEYIMVCSHGLVHVDHRQMHREAQELSIMIS